VTRLAARRFADSLLVLSMMFVAACGGGGVSGPAVTTGALAISPTAATTYTGVPTTFVVTGGTAPYFVSSSNGVALPVPSDPVNYNKVIVVPGDVGADTSVTLSVTDAAHSATVSSAVTVKPQTISNVVTVTPNPSQPASCGSSICAGGDATVSVKLSQAGIPLANRRVRFTVVSGPLNIITGTSGGTEFLSNTAEAVTDANGVATIRVRAGATSIPQTALLDATDEVSGATVHTSITVSPASNVPLTAQPATISFEGTTPNTCANGTSADVILFGGQAPYTVSQPAGFLVSPPIVTSDPGRFTVTATGTCSAGSIIGIVDAVGNSASVTVTNSLSQTPVPTTAPFKVAPDTVVLTSCSDVATVTLAGGTGNYYAASGSGTITARVQGNIGQIYRTPNTTSNPGQFLVAFSDGQSSSTVTVNLSTAASGQCPP
jgi:hypothetical protein